MTADFKALLSQQVQSVEAPKLFPIGNYDAICGAHELLESSKKETPFVRFQVKLVGPREDVDPDDFEEAGGMEKLQSRSALRYDFYLTPDAYFMLRQFIENSLDIQCSERSFDEVLPETEGVPFIANIRHTPGQREGSMYMEIAGHAIAA